MDWREVFFPRRCVGCGRQGRYFCDNCRREVIFKEREICPGCGRGAALGVTHEGCRRKTPLDGLTRVLAYRGIVRTAIKKIKYRLVSDLCQELAELALEKLREERWLRGKEWFLVPVPLHKKRWRWRGFNQAVELGWPLAEGMGWGWAPEILVRNRETLSQAEIKEKAAREENLKGAFGLANEGKNWVKGKSLILFDDVWTTGATMGAAGEALKEGGAKRVWGLALAG